jgi:hypothetical protein
MWVGSLWAHQQQKLGWLVQLDGLPLNCTLQIADHRIILDHRNLQWSCYHDLLVAGVQVLIRAALYFGVGFCASQHRLASSDHLGLLLFRSYCCMLAC